MSCAKASSAPRRNRKPLATHCGVRLRRGGWHERTKSWLEEDLKPISIGASLAHLDKLLAKYQTL